MRNYRPISLLPFASMIIENIVLIQTKEHLNTNGLLYKYQSKFRANPFKQFSFERSGQRLPH